MARQREKVRQPIVSPIGQIYTTDEVAAILKTSARTVQRLIRQGRLQAQRVGRGFRVREKDLEAYFDRERVR